MFKWTIRSIQNLKKHWKINANSPSLLFIHWSVPKIISGVVAKLIDNVEIYFASVTAYDGIRMVWTFCDYDSFCEPIKYRSDSLRRVLKLFIVMPIYFLLFVYRYDFVTLAPFLSVAHPLFLYFFHCKHLTCSKQVELSMSSSACLCPCTFA